MEQENHHLPLSGKTGDLPVRSEQWPLSTLCFVLFFTTAQSEMYCDCDVTWSCLYSPSLTVISLGLYKHLWKSSSLYGTSFSVADKTLSPGPLPADPCFWVFPSWHKVIGLWQIHSEWAFIKLLLLTITADTHLEKKKKKHPPKLSSFLLFHAKPKESRYVKRCVLTYIMSVSAKGRHKNGGKQHTARWILNCTSLSWTYIKAA